MWQYQLILQMCLFFNPGNCFPKIFLSLLSENFMFSFMFTNFIIICLGMKFSFLFSLLFLFKAFQFRSSIICGSHVQLFVTPWTVAHEAPLFHGISRQEHQSGLPFSSSEDLSDPGIEPRSPALQADSSPSELPEKPFNLLSYLSWTNLILFLQMFSSWLVIFLVFPVVPRLQFWYFCCSCSLNLLAFIS